MYEPEDKAEVADVLVTDEEVSVCKDKIETDQILSKLKNVMSSMIPY